MMDPSITFSAPGKIHLLGEHTVVYGKPALLAAVDLRVNVTLSKAKGITPGIYPPLITQDDKREPQNDQTSLSHLGGVTKIIEPIVKKHLKIKTIPSYQLTISSQIPIGAGLGSSAAVSASCIAALLSFLKVKWDLNLINTLTFEAEKAFHGNPSGGDNSAVVFGGLVWYRKESPDLKLIQPLPFIIPAKIAKNFVLINTGTPEETTKEMVGMVGMKIKDQRSKIKDIFDNQEQLVQELIIVLKEGSEKKLIQIIKAGEKNLERIGVVSSFAKSIIRKIEKAGGVAKICGGGGKTGPTGVLLCYHPRPSVISDLAKSFQLPYFKTTLGVKGLRQE